MVIHEKKNIITTVINDNNKPVVIFDNKTNNKIINKNTIKTFFAKKHMIQIVYYNQ